MPLADPALEAFCLGVEMGVGDDPRLVWHRKAREKQLAPDGDWRIWFVRGGRGSGKTASGAGALANWVLSDTDGEGEYGIIAPTYADAWTKCVEGEAGILQALGTSMAEIKDHRSLTVKAAWRTYGQVILHNGIIIYIDSAAEGGLRIQGRNLKGAWCDEIGLWLNWQVAWNESLRYAVRKGRSQIIATGTPKASRPARALVRSLLNNAPEHGGVANVQLYTEDNLDNLSEAFYRSVVGASAGTRLERQELFGDLLEDVEGALWSRDLLDSIRCASSTDEDTHLTTWFFDNGDPIKPGQLVSAYVGVDPSDGDEQSDEQAYTVMGKGPAGQLYVVESFGDQIGPVPFATKAILAAYRWQAGIVVEKNHGGAWMTEMLRQVTKELVRTRQISRAPHIETVWASNGKRTRAEPVAALYERYGGGLVHHAGDFAELEDQMATYTGIPMKGQRSPDRMDSLVWGMSKYLKNDFSGSVTQAAVHQWAASRAMTRMGDSPARRMVARLAGARPGPYDRDQQQRDDWSLESFAPKDDQMATAGSSNVYNWGG